MTMTRRQAVILMAGTAAATTFAGTAMAGDKTLVQVNMWDHGPDMVGGFDMSTRIMLGTAGVAYKDSAPMGFNLNKYVIPAGEVEFVATNTSTFLVHEMLVIAVPDVTVPMPYDTDTERLDEDAAGSLGEIAETEPGETGSLTLKLKPGTYMLTCNIAGHYAMGMWTLVTVV